MKSKTFTNSFLKENLKDQRWLILVMTLITFALYPALFILTLTQYEIQYPEHIDFVRKVQNYFAYTSDLIHGFSSTSILLLYVSLAVGIGSGILAFAYLHSKRKVAFYHSVPITRRELIITKYICFMLSYMIPLLISNAILVLILITRGLLSGVVIHQIAVLLFYNFMMFTIGYLLAAIAMLLTGKVFVGVLGVGVFLGYFPILALIFNTYIEEYMYHYFSEGHIIWGKFQLLARISPVTFIEWVEIDRLIGMEISILVAIVLWMIHAMLMKNRPSESAGKSMVYKRVGTVIQCALLFIATIGTAIFIVLAFNFFDVYLYLGGLFGLVISFVIIQLLYGVEFKELLKNKFVFLGVGAVSFLFIMMMKFDWVGYNSQLPDYAKIADINIEFNVGSQYSSVVLEEGIYEANMGKDEETYALMEAIIESSEKIAKVNQGYYEGYYAEDCVEIYVEYYMENGTVVKRSYTPLVADIQEELKYLWCNEEFLDIMYPIRLQEASKVTANNIYFEIKEDDTWDRVAPFEGDYELAVEFMEAYQEDAMKIDSSITSEIPVGSFSYRMLEGETTNYYYVLIYPSYENTLNFLEECNIELFANITADEIDRIDVYEVSEYYTTETETETDTETTLEYSDQGSIEVLLDDIIWTELQTIFIEEDTSKTANVILKDGTILYYDFLGN